MASGDLTTLDAVKTAIDLPDQDTDLDQLLPDLITQASQAIMNWCKREFAPNGTVATRRFRMEHYNIDLSPYDLQSATTVTLHPSDDTATTVLDTTDYKLKPVSYQHGVYTSLQISGYVAVVSQNQMKYGWTDIDIAGTWGFPEIPDAVIRAANVTVASWVTRTAPGVSSAYGIPTSGAMGATTFRADWHIPFAAMKLLSPYRRGSSKWVL